MDVAGWPEHALERLDACPVCGSNEAELLHEGLTDNVFDCAPGRWSLVACVGCRNAYLNPRPTPDSIGDAYTSYFTHESVDAPTRASAAEPTALRHRIRRTLVNGYVNRRFGAEFWPSHPAGDAMARAVAVLSRKLDLFYRCLPRVEPGMRLLDIGCGNGEFLIRASELGWNVAGAEPDPKAAAAARRHGLEIRIGGAEVFADSPGEFDAVTLSHVIEHVHDPAALVKQVHALLKPGGTLFVETPNLHSLGHRCFGPDWRGLEAPRHLVLFHRAGLAKLLADGGFRDLHFVRRPEVTVPMLQISARLRSRRIGDEAARASRGLPRRLRRLAATRRLDGLEFLTVTAIR